KWNSPFASKERELLGPMPRHLGGKPDDISLVVGVVRENKEGGSTPGTSNPRP
ncbi:protein phosphatase 2C, putative, partial [Eimeria tenella]